MGIDGINNSQVSWQSFLTNVQNAEASSKVGEIKQRVAQSANLTVEEGHTLREVAVSVPTLSAPAGTDSFGLETLSAKLSEGNLFALNDAQAERLLQTLNEQMSALQSAANSAGVSVTSSSSGGVFFNLYQLMTLLASVAQQLRDSTREIRSAESQAIQTSILNQAEQQKAAALTGLIIGAVCCALQVGATIGGLVKQGKAFSDQMSAHGQSGVGRAQAELKMAEMQASAPDAAKNYHALANKLGADKAQSILDTFDGSKQAGENLASAKATLGHLEMRKQALGNVEAKQATPEQMTAARTELDNARAGETTAQQELTAAQDALKGTETQLAEAEANLSTVTERLPKAQAEITDLQKQKATVDAQIQELEAQNIGNSGEQIANAQQQITENQARIDTATAKLTGVKGELTQVEGQIRSAEGNLEAIGQRISDAQTELQGLQTQKADLEAGLRQSEAALADKANPLPPEAKQRLEASLTQQKAQIADVQRQIDAKGGEIHDMKSMQRTEQAKLTELQGQRENLTYDIDTLETEIEIAGQNRAMAEGSLSNAEADFLSQEANQAKIDSLRVKSEQLQGQIETRQAEVTTLQEQKGRITAQMDELQAVKAEQSAQVTQAQENLTAAKERVETAQKSLQTLNDQNEAVQIERDMPQAQKRVEDARLAYKAALQSEASQARSDYERTKAAVENPPKGANLAELKETAAQLKERAEFAEAYAAKELTGVLTGEEKATALADAKANFQSADSLFAHSEKFLRAQHASDRARALSDLVGVLGNFGQSMAQGVTNMMNAEATEMAVKQKAAEEELNQITDLFQGAGDLTNAVLSLMQAVQQAENESMQETIRA